MARPVGPLRASRIRASRAAVTPMLVVEAHAEFHRGAASDNSRAGGDAEAATRRVCEDREIWTSAYSSAAAWSPVLGRTLRSAAGAALLRR